MVLLQKFFQIKFQNVLQLDQKRVLKRKMITLVIDTSIVRGIKNSTLYISTLVKAQNLMIFLQNIQTQDLYRGFR